MIGLLIVTHGRLGEFLLDTAEMLVSDTSLVRTVSFLPGQGVEDLEQAVSDTLSEMNSVDGILCLADLPGGSPARVLGSLLLQDTRLELLTGVNLPMLVEVLMMRNNMTLRELTVHAAASGCQGIVDVGEMVRQEA